MKILVFIKQIPDINDIKFDENTKRIIRSGVKLMINSFDKKAVEEAIRLDEKYNCDTYVATMGPPQAMDILKDSIKMGIKHGILISDKNFGGSDTYVTSRILSEAVKIIKPDLVLTGKYSLDGETSQVPPEIACLSNYNFKSSISGIEIKNNSVTITRDEDNGIRTMEMELPAVLSVSEKINRARPVPNIQIKEEIKIYDSSIIKNISGKESPTEVIDTYKIEDSRKNEFIDFNKFIDILNSSKNNIKNNNYDKLYDHDSDEIFLGLAVDDSITSREISSKIAEINNNKMKIVFIGNIDPEKIDGMSCHEYIYLKDSDNLYISEYVINYIRNNNVKHILCPSNLNGRDISSYIAASLGLGLTADCVDISLKDGKMIQYKPSFGGGIIAVIRSKTSPDIATVRKGMFKIKYESYDYFVDIVNAEKKEKITEISYDSIGNKFNKLNTNIIFGIGTGVKRDYINKLMEIADKMHASIGATRKVVDMHLIPRQFQIGLTGISISPELYIAIGISGADNHIVGIRYSKKIVAVNTKKSDIFKHSDYGLIMDSSEFIDKLYDYINSN